MNKRIVAILLSIILLLVGGIGGYFLADNKNTKVSTYDIVYKNIDKLSEDEKLNLYSSKLKAEVAPSEVKFLLDKIAPSVNNDTQNKMLAQYINHIQYYLSTYSDFVQIYQTIMGNIGSTVDFEDPSSADKISDKVLKTIITEIYESNMRIVMPGNYSDDSPYVLINYDNILSEYKDTINDATKDYIAFKEVAQNGELSDETGKYDMDRLGSYLIQANNFINKYPDYPLVGDIIFSYILASKMYLGTYNVSEDFMPDETTIKKYKTFTEKYPDTPITNALKEIIELYNNGEKVTMEKVTVWNNALDSLLGQQK